MIATARTLVLALLAAVALANILLALGVMDGASDDFLPLWVFARLAVTGHGARSYDFATQVAVLDDPTLPGYRVYLPDAPHFKGIGLCPYPPPLAVLYAPLGALPFDPAAQVMYLGSVALVVVAGWAIAGAVGGRLSGLAATVAILYYPGLYFALWLGQNSLLTLALLALGWHAAANRRDFVAGLWWGVLAYKPPWLVAVGWLPLALGRPRMWAGMAASAGLLCAVATTWLGPAAWGRWFEQVTAVDRVFATDPEYRATLLLLGCDLRSVLTSWCGPTAGRPLAWVAIVAITAVTTVWYRCRPSGSAAAGLLFAAGLTAPHLYYYDEVVFLLPLLLLWARRAVLTWWALAALVVLSAAFYAALWGLLWSGWPVPTAIALALWLFSLAAARRVAPAPA